MREQLPLWGSLPTLCSKVSEPRAGDISQQVTLWWVPSHARRALSRVPVSTHYYFSIYDNEQMSPDTASVPRGTKPALVDCSQAKPSHPGRPSRPSREL